LRDRREVYFSSFADNNIEESASNLTYFAIEKCFSVSDVVAILIDPLANNERSHRFYKRLGFVFVERRQFDESSDCFVFRLDRKDWFNNEV